jgi:hypothetical protein
VRSRRLSFPVCGSLGAENWKTGDSPLITNNLELSDASRTKTETGKLKLAPGAIPPFYWFAWKPLSTLDLIDASRRR